MRHAPPSVPKAAAHNATNRSDAGDRATAIAGPTTNNPSAIPGQISFPIVINYQRGQLDTHYSTEYPKTPDNRFHHASISMTIQECTISDHTQL
jgi:hypothetical protein